jgi:SAM-dependent methyltransferase
LPHSIWFIGKIGKNLRPIFTKIVKYLHEQRKYVPWSPQFRIGEGIQHSGGKGPPSLPVFSFAMTDNVRYITIVSLITQSYSDLPVHKLIGRLIRRHSVNKEDVRDLAIRLVDWDGIHAILDLGSGYGWCEEGLKGSFDLVLGIDCLEENRDEFLKTAGAHAKKAVFRNILLPAPIETPADHFDLVTAAYSLYFFPETLGEIARVLRPGGTFLVITHSEAMLEEGERFFSFSNLKRVIRGFSAENGEAILRRHFTRITSVDYANSLVFDREDSRDLALYIEFKGAFIARDVAPEQVKDAMLKALETEGRLIFNKNDRIFVVQK